MSLYHTNGLSGRDTDFLVVVATSIKVEPDSSPGDFQSLSRLPHCLSSSPSVGSSPSHPVGSSRLVERKRPVTSLEDSVARLVKMWARPRRNSRISATLLSSKERPLRPSLTSRCFSVLAPVSSTLAAVFNWLSGFKSCKSGSVSPV